MRGLAERRISAFPGIHDPAHEHPHAAVEITRDGHGLGPSMGWIGLGWVAFSSTSDGLGCVALNEKYCYFFTAFCVCYNITCYAVYRQSTRHIRFTEESRTHIVVLYPQNGDRVVTVNSATSLHPLYSRTGGSQCGLSTRDALFG